MIKTMYKTTKNKLDKKRTFESHFKANKIHKKCSLHIFINKDSLHFFFKPCILRQIIMKSKRILNRDFITIMGCFTRI